MKVSCTSFILCFLLFESEYVKQHIKTNLPSQKIFRWDPSFFWVINTPRARGNTHEIFCDNWFSSFGVYRGLRFGAKRFIYREGIEVVAIFMEIMLSRQIVF